MAGFIHPLIHLGFGIEFEQPAIIAEALAQASIHPNWVAPLYIEPEEAAKRNGNPDKTLFSLLDDIRRYSNLVESSQWQDPNKFKDGILKRGLQNMIEIASQYVVPEGNLDEKTAEMINAVGSSLHYSFPSNKDKTS